MQAFNDEIKEEVPNFTRKPLFVSGRTVFLGVTCKSVTNLKIFQFNFFDNWPACAKPPPTPTIFLFQN